MSCGGNFFGRGLQSCDYKQTCETPPPPPPGPSTWPTFQTAALLSASPWGQYYKSVYGTIPSSASDFPLAVGSNWLLYDSVLISAHVPSVPAAQTCPTRPGDRYNVNDAYQPSSVSWIWHSYPYAARPASSWVEIIHEADPFGDETHGMWTLYTPGSGIWLNTGKTIAFAEHEDAYRHFNVPSGGDQNSQMAQLAASAGYDTVQFLAHVDHVSYQCDSHNTGVPGFDYMGLEVVAVKLVGTYACGDVKGAPSVVRKGWGASETCICDNKKQFLNCAGVPTMSANLRRANATR